MPLSLTDLLTFLGEHIYLVLIGCAELGLQNLRYGSDPLPQGQLKQAGALHEGMEERLSVRAGQEKTLYLRAFVGAEYADGAWLPLSNAAYGGSYAGMLDWLAEQGFDPMTQPAAYYALSDPDSVPQVNPLHIQVPGGSRGVPIPPRHYGQRVRLRPGEERPAPRPPGAAGCQVLHSHGAVLLTSGGAHRPGRLGGRPPDQGTAALCAGGGSAGPRHPRPLRRGLHSQDRRR